MGNGEFRRIVNFTPTVVQRVNASSAGKNMPPLIDVRNQHMKCMLCKLMKQK
jgi:hypothetical protein